jgi:hypothetical protein
MHIYMYIYKYIYIHLYIHIYMYVYTEIIHEDIEMSGLGACCKYGYRLSTHLPLYQQAHQHQYALREGAN